MAHLQRLAGWLASRQLALSMLFLLGWMLFAAVRAHGDASYDLANYHLYGPFALLHGKLGHDLAPAQAQGYLPPLNDLPYYLLSRRIANTRALNALLVLPEAVALCLVFLLTVEAARATGVSARLVALVSVVIGGTGAATHPVLATSMSDMTSCALILGAMLMLLRLDRRLAVAPAWRIGLAGLLVGVGLGLKLTLAYAAAGMAAGLLAWTGVPAQARLRAAVLLSLGAAVGLVGCDGWWWVRLYRYSGNPLFPLYNNVFGSALATAGHFIDIRFLPRNRMQALVYPFLWAVDPTPLVTEPDQPMRDPRIALGLLGCLGLLGLGVWRRTLVTGPVRFLCVLFLVGYVLWERQFSIFRYLSLLELLSGPMLAVLALTVLRDPRGHREVLAGGLALLALLVLYTVQPNWGRQPHAGGRPLAEVMPILPADSLVLFLDKSPLAYLATRQPDTVRFYGTNNNLTQPWLPTLMPSLIRNGVAAQLRGHPDLLWGIQRPDHRFGNPDATLALLGLHRAGCQTFTSNITDVPLLLCRLARN